MQHPQEFLKWVHGNVNISRKSVLVKPLGQAPTVKHEHPLGGQNGHEEFLVNRFSASAHDEPRKSPNKENLPIHLWNGNGYTIIKKGGIMGNLKRKQIYIDEESERALKTLALATKVSESEHIRRTVKKHIAKQKVKAVV